MKTSKKWLYLGGLFVLMFHFVLAQAEGRFEKSYVSVVTVIGEGELILGHPATIELANAKAIYMYELKKGSKPKVLGKYEPAEEISAYKTSVILVKKFKRYHPPAKGKQYMVAAKFGASSSKMRDVASRDEGVSRERIGAKERHGGRRSSAQISAELLGAGLFYSVFGSYRPADFLAFNLGFCFFPVSYGIGAVSISYSLIEFPVSASLLIGGPNGHLEILAGGDFAFPGASGTLDTAALWGGGSMVFLPQFGIGYRYWPKDGGFHFRATGYVILGKGTSINMFTGQTTSVTLIAPYLGVSFGYAF